MPTKTYKFVQTAFTGGIMSDVLVGRTDYDRRFISARVAQNFLPMVQGPLASRPPTIYNSGVFNNNKRTHLIGLNAASGTNYLVEMSEYAFRFHQANSLVQGTSTAVATAGNSNTVTFSAPGGANDKLRVTLSNHNLPIGAVVRFSTTGTLPTNLTAATNYYVVEGDDYYADMFNIAATPNGTPITGGADPTGNPTHTMTDSVLKLSTARGYVNDDLVSISGATGLTTINNDSSNPAWAVKCAHATWIGDVTMANTGDLCTLNSHGLSNDDKIMFVPESGATLASGASRGTIYYVKVVDANTFQVREELNKSIRTFGSNSYGTIKIALYTESYFDRFQISTPDGTLDMTPQVDATSASGGQYKEAIIQSQSTNSTDLSAGGYDASSASSVWAGKHHVWSESIMFDSNNRFDLGYEVLGDSIYFAGGSKWPRKLTVNTSTDWDFVHHAEHVYYTLDSSGEYQEAPYFRDGPYSPQNTDSRKKITIFRNHEEGRLNTLVEIDNKDSAAFQSSDQNKVFRLDGAITTGAEGLDGLNPTWFLLTQINEWTDDGAASGTGDAVGLMKDNGWKMAVFSGSTWIYAWAKRWKLGLYGAEFPRRITFAQDRCILAGLSSKPTQIDMSEISDYTSFAPSSADDWTQVLPTNAISIAIAAQSTGKVEWVRNSDYGVIVGCEGGLYLLSGKQTGQLVPSEVSQTLISSYGTENIAPIIIGSSIFYVEKGGKAIRRVTGGQEDSMEASRLFFDALESPIVGWGFGRKVNPIIWCYLADGSMVSITIELGDGIFAASTHVLGGTNVSVESVASVRDSNGDDDVYFSVKRTVNGGTVRYIERLSDSVHEEPSIAKENYVCGDCAYQNLSLSSDNVPAGALSHLEGETVDVLADGIVYSRTVSSGVFSSVLPASVTKISVGLPVAYVFESMDMQLPKGDNILGARIRINAVDVGFYRSLGGSIGEDSSNQNAIPSVRGDGFNDFATSNDALFTGVKKLPFNGTHNSSARVRIEQNNPLPMCITYLVCEGIPYD